MRRRIYKLKTKFTILGMDGVDWGIIIGTFAVTANTFQSTVGGRGALLLSIVCTALTYFTWHLVKDRVPENFSAHFMKWLAEPEVYKVVPDLQNVPLVVDFEEVQRTSKRGKHPFKEREEHFTDQVYKRSERSEHIHSEQVKPRQARARLNKTQTTLLETQSSTQNIVTSKNTGES